MALKIIENFDGSFTLEPQAKENLFNLLTSEAFLNQICQNLQCEQLEFTELLFQPVPYSLATPKGMPAEFEQYHDSDEYVIINVPPNFMFTAKIFQPSRLCAVYKKSGIGDRGSEGGHGRQGRQGSS
jgi:hypothetical protein